MATSIVALCALVLLAGCASSAAPLSPDGESDQLAAAAGGRSTASASLSTTSSGCPLSNEGLDEGISAFTSVESEASSGPVPKEETVYEACETSFRWATSRTVPGGLFVRFHVETGDEARCLATFLAAGSEPKPGPLSVGIAQADHGAGWGTGSTEPMARVQVLGVDSNDVLWGGGGQWAGGSGLGFGGGAWDVTFASQAVSAWENDLSGGWAAVVGLVCTEPLEVSGIEAAHEAHLYDQYNLEGGASAQSYLGGASLGDQAHATLDGEATTVIAGAFSEQAWRLQLQHPEGTEQAVVLPTDSGEFTFRGQPGEYTATLDKLDGPVFNAWWLIMAGADGYPSLAGFE